MTEPSLDDWREQASAKLEDRIQRATTYQLYYDGDPEVLAMLETEERQTFRKLLREARANWCEIVVNAVAERLQVDGFHFGTGADDRAWQLWQASSMDADGELVQTDGLVTGSGYVLVQPDEENPTGVEISVESPFEAVVLYEPGHRRRRLAGFKRYAENEEQVEVLILPDQVATWWPDDTTTPQVENNPAGLVGMVEVRPQPRSRGAPRSELHSAIPFQDRINTTIWNRMVATDYGAFRQVWATGVRLRREIVQQADGEVERVVRPYNVGANRLLVNENPEGRFGSFPESTLAGYLTSVEQDVNQLAAITQTPPHYLLGQMVNLSADAIKAAEAGLVAKVKRRARHIGEAWEEVMRVALGLVGDPAAVNVAAEVVWKDFETRSEAQLADALTKMQALAVPDEVLWQRWGASPQDIREWKRINEEAAANAAATQAAALGATDAYAQLLAGGGGGGAPAA